MAKTTNQHSFKAKLLVVLTLVCVLCFGLFCFTACNPTSSSYKDKDYTVSVNDTATINNGSFEFVNADLKDTDFPQTSSSVTGWTLSNDNSSHSSLVNSGIINTSDSAWSTLMNTLYNDSDFLAYMEAKFNFDVEDIKTANPDWSSDEIKEHVVSNYFTQANFPNPKTHAGAEGDLVYMLNNYVSVSSYGGTGLGAAQKLTSTSTVTLEAGSYGVISVWVKTANLDYNGVGNMYGANVRLTNTVSSVAQDTYRISGIRNTDWTEYKIYLKADDFVDQTVTIVVGLGYGDGSSTNTKYYCEGTVYFDNITFNTELTEAEYNAAVSSITEDVLKYNTQDQKGFIDHTANEGTVFAYNMNLNDSLSAYASDFYSDLSVTTTSGYTTSSSGISGGKWDTNSLSKVETISNNGLCSSLADSAKMYKITLQDASYFLQFGDKLNPVAYVGVEEYVFLNFFVKKELAEFDKNGITAYVYDVANGEEVERKYYTLTFTEDQDWLNLKLTIVNNYPEINIDKNESYNTLRSFYVKFVIGPSSVANTTVKSEFATGTVYISNPLITTGKNYQYVRNEYVGVNGSTGNTYESIIGSGDYVKKYTTTEVETKYYNYFNLFNADTNLSVPLYTGASEDYSAVTDTTSFSMSTSPSDTGTIMSAAANVDGYAGITNDHIYINSNSSNAKINTRSGDKDADGNEAGLINTAYLDNYSNKAGIETALNHTGTSPIQPLMIYNKTEGSYGFIGESQSLSADTMVDISFRVRVVGDAKAYIYLIDTSKTQKNILTISVPVNTTGSNYINSDNVVTYTKQFVLTIDSSDMDSDGWATVHFYIASGINPINYRIEMWNGSRDGAMPSSGYVFFNDVSNSNTFNEVSTDNYKLTFTTDGVLKDAAIKYGRDVLEASSLLYRRELDSIEVKYNADSSRTGNEVVYNAKYVYAKTNTMIYAIYNTLPGNFNAVDPYASEPAKEDAGCTATTDPSTFWLSFSTIILAAALFFAILALVIKTMLRRRKANANDAKSHYNVKSRIKVEKKSNKVTEKAEQPEETQSEEVVEPVEEVVEESSNETTEEVDEVVEESTEETTSESSDYIYGEVQDFGEPEDKKE